MSTRMHSGRMLTVRSSDRIGGCTWSWGGVPGPGGCTWSRGVYLVTGGVPGPGGVTGPGQVYLVLGGCTWSWGVYLVPGRCTWFVGCTLFWGVYLVPGGCTWSWGVCTWSLGGTWSGTPPCGQTHTCKYLTFTTSLRTVKSEILPPVVFNIT